MALPNPNQKIISTGAFCSVFIYQNNVKKVLGLVTNASYNEDFNVTEAQVIGFFGPVSLDVQNYRCSITLGTLVPANPRGATTEPWLDGGEVTLPELLKTRTQIALTGTGSVFDQLDFADRQSGNIIASFKYVVISANGAQINPATYVTSNMQLMAIEKTY
jgi:hypothetical protein